MRSPHLLFIGMIISIQSTSGQVCTAYGNAGSSYWQQRVNYAVQAELFPDSSLLKGEAHITYSNNSPDTLRSIYWHLYQNIFKEKSEGRKLFGETGRISAYTEGMTIDMVIIDGSVVTPEITSTIMETKLTSPLLPHSQAAITIRWKYEIPRNPDLRTGRDKTEFGMCQWYPQIAVYDGRSGWDMTQYLGQAEFYTEYGDWNVEITVPGNHIIAATGVLQNGSEVLTADQLMRLSSITSDSTLSIIPIVETDSSRLAMKEKRATWRFTADNVRDFAWASSPRFVWDGTKTNSGIPIYAFYLPGERTAENVLVGETDNWNKAAAYAKRTIEFFSEQFGEYVYPQATVVSGPVTGMEYPMLAFIVSGDALTTAMYYIIVHELGHQWSPMMIGSNETNYAFMDEGFTQFMSSVLVETDRGENGLASDALVQKFGWLLPSTNERLFFHRFLLESEKQGKVQSLLSHSYLMPRQQYGTTVYFKTQAVMFMLQDVLGKDLFRKAMREYCSRWKFRHPLPHDFFHTIEDVAGRDLDWFWHEWFEETYLLDMAVRGVNNEEHEGMWRASIELENLEQAIMPATLRLYLQDGSTKDVRFSESAWMYRNRYTHIVEGLHSKVRRVELDPDLLLLDINRMNNTSGLPNIQFDYGMNLLNVVLYPIDAYRVNVAPSLFFNNRDGFDIGTSISGNYLRKEYDANISLWYGTRSNVVDYHVSYSTPISYLSPNLSTTVKGFRLDGRTGYYWSIDAEWERYHSIYSNLRRAFGITASVYAISLRDSRYVNDPFEWTLGHLVLGTISLRYKETYSWGKASLEIAGEAATPGSTFSYVKWTTDARLEAKLWRGISTKIRFFSGISDGVVPAQTAHSLVQSTPLNRFDSWVFRTPWTSRSLRSHFVSSGGGNLFLSHDTTASRVYAGNIELKKGIFVLFADAGTVYHTVSQSKLFCDAGAGLAWDIGDVNLAGLSVSGIGLGVYFPLYVKDPSRRSEKEFAYRWKIIFGVRL